MRYSPEKAQLLIDRATKNKDVDADAALCFIAAEHLRDGVALPRELALYVSAVLAERFVTRKAPHKDSYATVLRDGYIDVIVYALEQVGLSRYRNREKKDRECAFSLTAKILTDAGVPTTERAVEESWRRRKWARSRSGIPLIFGMP